MHNAGIEAGGVQVGRDSERERLKSLLRDASAGRPGAVLVVGEPGIGKTSLVAGRTYAEIAEALVISEKTVSVHVSNLLRKTGTSSRIELAERVRRGT